MRIRKSKQILRSRAYRALAQDDNAARFGEIGKGGVALLSPLSLAKCAGLSS